MAREMVQVRTGKVTLQFHVTMMENYHHRSFPRTRNCGIETAGFKNVCLSTHMKMQASNNPVKGLYLYTQCSPAVGLLLCTISLLQLSGRSIPQVYSCTGLVKCCEFISLLQESNIVRFMTVTCLFKFCCTVTCLLLYGR